MSLKGLFIFRDCSSSTKLEIANIDSWEEIAADSVDPVSGNGCSGGWWQISYLKRIIVHPLKSIHLTYNKSKYQYVSILLSIYLYF